MFSIDVCQISLIPNQTNPIPATLTCDVSLFARHHQSLVQDEVVASLIKHVILFRILIVFYITFVVIQQQSPIWRWVQRLYN